MGRSLEDVRAVLLTHAHDDHIGFAERIRSERGTPIHLHEADAALARGEAKQKNEGGGPMRPIPMLSFLRLAIRKGGLRIKRIAEVSTFGDGATLDVPGTPRVIHLPGHTAGSAALVVPSRDAILVGDAFVTLNVMSGSTGLRSSSPTSTPTTARPGSPTPRWARGVAGAARSWPAVDRRPGRSPPPGPDAAPDGQALVPARYCRRHEDRRRPIRARERDLSRLAAPRRLLRRRLRDGAGRSGAGHLQRRPRPRDRPDRRAPAGRPPAPAGWRRRRPHPRDLQLRHDGARSGNARTPTGPVGAISRSWSRTWPRPLEAVEAGGGAAFGDVVTMATKDGRRLTWCYATDPDGNIIELQTWHAA